MKNFIMNGNTITLPAPHSVTSGQGLLVGSIFGVASGSAALGGEVEVMLQGVFTLPKVVGTAWTIGAPIYWNNTSKNCTIAIDNNKLIGVAIFSALTTDATGVVRLNGSFGGDAVKGTEKTT